MRVEVLAGSEGGDFQFYAEPDLWGRDGISGNPFSVGPAMLDGPGVLTLESVLIADPSPTSCFRGGFQGARQHYRLTLPADTATTIVLPVRATAASLAWGRGITFVYPGEADRMNRLHLPVEVGGPRGVFVDFTALGAVRVTGKVTAGKTFRLAGRTEPAIGGRKIVITAEPRMRMFDLPDPGSRTLATVTTKSDGTFTSGPVSLPGDAVWVLSAKPKPGPGYDDGPSCGPVVTSASASRKAYPSDLVGKTFRSTSVKGARLIGPRAIKLSFAREPEGTDPDDGVPPRWVDVLTGNAGCNTLSGRYWLKNGRLVWSHHLAGTKMGCAEPVDQWLKKTLRRGVNARIAGGRLVLSNSRGLKIVLKLRS